MQSKISYYQIRLSFWTELFMNKSYRSDKKQLKSNLNIGLWIQLHVLKNSFDTWISHCMNLAFTFVYLSNGFFFLNVSHTVSVRLSITWQNASSDAFCRFILHADWAEKYNKVLLRDRKRHTARRVVACPWGGGWPLPPYPVWVGQGEYPLSCLMVCSHCLSPDSGTRTGKKWVVWNYTERFTLHRDRDPTVSYCAGPGAGPCPGPGVSQCE